jgi:uncharacterized membrane protein
MTWERRFRLREYLRGSLWFLPLIAAALGPLLATVCVSLEGDVGFAKNWQYSSGTASTLLTSIVAAMVALTGFVVTLGVLIVQMATGTLSPRFMRLWYRDRLQKAVLGVFLGTLTFSFALLRHIEDDAVPNLGVSLAGALVLLGLILFLLYLDRFVHRLRPVVVARLVGRAGARVFAETDGATAAGPQVARPAGPPSLVVHCGVGGAIQAVDERGLLSAAVRGGCVIGLCHPVGDFVTRGTPLLEVWGPPGLDARRLQGMVALGDERTLEQDAAFGLRIMVDIALAALSPAVNAPTTAVQVINYVEELLQHIGEQAFGAGKVLRGSDGAARVVLRGRGWEEYLELGVVEIRVYGANAPQVTRRLRAALQSLAERVHPAHRPAVIEQLALLDAAVAGAEPDEASRAYALRADRQGIGG